MRRLTLALVLACFGCASGPSAREQALVAELEKRVVLPRGAGELRCYTRYYALVRGKQLEELLGVPGKLPMRELLIGTYREPKAGEKPGIRWVASPSDVPRIHDAGCSSMTVWYDPDWPEKQVQASCSPDFAGSVPQEIHGKPLRC